MQSKAQRSFISSRTAILRGKLNFHHIAIAGPLEAGKSELAARLAVRLNATVVNDETTENPFLEDFYAGTAGAAFQTQLFSLLARHRQQITLRQTNLFSQTTICDYLFDKDKIYAYLNLDDNELFIYQRLFDLLARDIVSPDIVIFLQAPPEVLCDRLEEHSRHDPELSLPDTDYIRELCEAYNYFFFHYTATSLLVVETSHFDLGWTDETIDDLIKQLEEMTGGTRYYVPRIDP